jgi:anti-sigma B factor antagonist
MPRMADGEPAGLDGVRVVRLPGCVDVGNAMDVRAALAGELRDGVRVLVADLAATASLALEGLQVLVLVRAAAARRGAELRLAAARPAVARYLELTGTARMFPLYDSVDRARAAGRPAGSRLRPGRSGQGARVICEGEQQRGCPPAG